MVEALGDGDRHGLDWASQTQAAERPTLWELTQSYEEHPHQVGQTLRWLLDIPLATHKRWNLHL